jgi:hypothetical protein
MARSNVSVVERRRGALALIAALSLWFQIFVPVVGGTARLLVLEHHHASGQDTHQHHREESSPGIPNEGHGHLGLCCIVSGGKLGTGFAPPPTASHVAQVFPAPAVAIVYQCHAAPVAEGRSVLPVGARAPPRFV